MSNDFHDSEGLYSIFDGLEVPELDQTIEVCESIEELAISDEKPKTNGVTKVLDEITNGVAKLLGVEATNGVPASPAASVQTSRPEIAN